MNSIKFVNENKEVMAVGGTNLRLKAIECGVDLYKGITKVFNCRGNGKCGNCVVEVIAGQENLSLVTAFEEQKLKTKSANYRLACQSQVNGNVTVKTKP